MVSWFPLISHLRILGGETTAAPSVPTGLLPAEGMASSGSVENGDSPTRFSWAAESHPRKCGQGGRADSARIWPLGALP